MCTEHNICILVTKNAFLERRTLLYVCHDVNTNEMPCGYSCTSTRNRLAQYSEHARDSTHLHGTVQGRSLPMVTAHIQSIPKRYSPAPMLRIRSPQVRLSEFTLLFVQQTTHKTMTWDLSCLNGVRTCVCDKVA